MPQEQAYIEIPLTRGQITRVSANRLPEISSFMYYAKWNRLAQAFYAVRNVRVGPYKQRVVYLHRELLGLSPDDPREGDHRDRDPLNNVDENLRIGTRQQNNCNQGLRKDNKTGYKGVTFRNGMYRARIRVFRVEIFLGNFRTPEEAARAYDVAAIKYFGEFAYLNFPKEGFDAQA